MTKQGPWQTSAPEVDDVVKWVRENPPNGAAPQGEYVQTYPMNDAGNAKRFAAKFGGAYRYNHDTKEWYRWDGVIWRKGDKAQVQEDAKTISLDIARDGRQIPLDVAVASNRHHPDFWKQEWRKAMLAWAKQSGMEHHITRLLKLATSIAPIAAVTADLDADKVLMAFPNGYLNLKTGEFTAPIKDKLVTKVAGAPRVPQAHCPLWDMTFTRFQPNEAARRDLETAWGYGWSGRGKEHMFIARGPTRTGKSTIISAVRAALGDYAGTVELESLTQDKHHSGSGAREDLVALVGKRMVVTSEASEHQRISAALLKRLLGGSDKLSIRANYGKQFESLPTFAMWLLTNETPKLTADDDAVWERVHVFAFEQQIPPDERDETERDKVVNPEITGSAILWAIEQGWWRFVREQKGRLSLPTTVQETDTYREEQDHVAQFIEERCTVGSGESCTVEDFKRAFRTWLKREDIHETYTDIRIGKAMNRAKNADGTLKYPEFRHPKTHKRSRAGVSVPRVFDDEVEM
jgi:putative DNA primase/helicase